MTVKLHAVAVACAIVATSPTQAQTAASIASPGQFATATGACFAALRADSPVEVAQALEGQGWVIVRNTPLGGILRYRGNPVELRVESVLGSRICTLLANRDPAIALNDFAQLVTADVQAIFPDRVTLAEGRSDFTLVLDEQYLAAVTTSQNNPNFNTQITTIER